MNALPDLTWTEHGKFEVKTAPGQSRPATDAEARGGPKAHFMAYGTVRMADDVTQPGSANKYLPELLTLSA